MRKFKRILYVWLLLTGSHTLLAQPLEPWINGQVPPVNGGYEWRVASGSNRTEAFNDFQHFLSTRFGCVTKTEAESEMFIDQANLDREQRDELTIKSFTNCEGGTVWFVRAKEKEVRDEWGTKVYQLYQFSSAGEFAAHHLDYRLVDDFDKSKATALSFVPFGTAQFYKGNRGMGAFFLATEAVALAGAGMAWKLSSDYYDDFQRERNTAQRADYKRLSESTETLSYISLGVAGGLYVWQVLHGLYGEGRRKKWDLALMPYASPNSNGLALSFKF